MMQGQVFLLLLFLTALVSRVQGSTCFESPSQTQCTDASSFYSSLDSDLASACQTWSYASGCSIRTACKEGKVTGQLCDSWSLLIEVCSDPIVPTTNSSCSSYHKLCDPADSVVDQCKTKTVGKFLQTQTAIDDMVKLCTEMPDMPQCPKCTSSKDPKANCPDPFLSVSEVCQSMWMADCQNWYDMCQTQPVAFSYFCGSMSPSTSEGVQQGEVCFGKMIMFFHTGLDDVVLFKSWVPCTRGRYALTFLGIVVCGLVSALIKAVRTRIEQRWTADDMQAKLQLQRRKNGQEEQGAEQRINVDGKSLPLQHDASSCSEGSRWLLADLLPDRIELRRNVFRFLFSFVVVMLDYALMLIAMTFNVGLFFAVILGLSLGTLFFGHVGKPPKRVTQVNGSESSQLLALGDEQLAASAPFGNHSSCCSDS